MFISVLTQYQYNSFVGYMFRFLYTIFRTMLITGRYIQCVHTLWDPIGFA